jgi:HPr kinase/phosphorylase
VAERNAPAKGLTVEDFFQSKSASLALELMTGGVSLKRRIESATISSPGLVLAGFTDRFARGRLQVLGETEIRYLNSLDDAALEHSVETFLSLDMPCIFVTKGQEIPHVLLAGATRHSVPVICTRLKTGDFFRRVQPYLEEQFAPSTTLHGSLADVYGVGLLFMGKSGIGKSECVLDLVERGHRLVADDLVHVTQRGNDILIGRGHELQRHHMEIRGIGIIDISALFGIRAIRQQKRIEVVVHLDQWSDATHYDRSGLDVEEMDVLGVKLPRVTVPLNPGKNITVMSEVVAMNHLLKYSGTHSAHLFNKRLQNSMNPIRDYLQEDYE